MKRVSIGPGGTMKHCTPFSVLAMTTISMLSLALSACSPASKNSSELAASADSGIVAGTVVQASDAVAASTVALYLRSADGEGVCTGTLVASNVVLTAAHCVDGLQAAVVIFGTNLDTATEVRNVDAAVVHPSYAPRAPGTGGWNDLALFRFQGTAPASAKIANILTSAASLKKGLKSVAAGFGTTLANGRGQDEGTLRKVTLTLQNPAYEKTELLFPLSSTGGSTCHGDSGGPAYATLNGKLTLIGVTSRGTGADCRNVSIFTSVAAHAAFIQKTIQDLQKAATAEPAKVASATTQQ